MGVFQGFFRTQNEKERSYQTDYLTGVPDRKGLYDYYEALRTKEKIHVLFINVDNFRQVNEIYGHSIGDQLLKNIASCIKSVVKEGFVARVGGDEFLIIQKGNLSEDTMKELAGNIIDFFGKSIFRQDISTLITLSIGIILNQSVEQTLDELFSKSNLAMYKARALGKNQYAIYKSDKNAIEINKNIEAEMHRAILTGQFEAFLQPKIDMLNNCLVGAEALSRWKHPTDGLRAPAQFIPLFEKNGFIIKLDRYIFEEVCKIKQSWKGSRLEKLPISLNMDRLHFYENSLPEDLYAIAQKYKVNASEIELEITESMFFNDSTQLIRMVERLKEKGFLISIDDFGSGYSALNMIKNIPVDTIKIDREFLQLSVHDIKGKRVVSNVINMCRDLKVKIVAEGVEDVSQIEFLTSCGCQIAQGFYFAKPISIEDFEKFYSDYCIDTAEAIRFTFDQTILSTNKEFAAEYVGEGFSFVEGFAKGTGAIRFPGGDKNENILKLPARLFYHDNYTLSFWMRPEKSTEWGSILYAKYENGFFTVSMEAVEGKLTFRFRDIKEVEGYHDVVGNVQPLDTWTFVAISYEYVSETAKLYVNGELAASLSQVPTMTHAKLIYLGGDIYKDSFQGEICDLMICSHVRTDDEVRQLFETYISTYEIKNEK